MKKWFLRSVYAVLAALLTAGLVYHVGLRHWCLRWGTTPAEVHATLPGDDLFPVYTSEATHAITVNAPPERIWPWLMQIGQDRSGFYSYTFLENAIGAEMPKVERIVPAWRERTVGETVWFAAPARFAGQGRMTAAIVQPGRSFVMVMPDDYRRLHAGGRAQQSFWSFTIQPTGNGQTRLIARIRGGTPPTLIGKLAGRLFWEPAHFVMEQRMLRRIRDLSENS
jgi:hypothetical protein